MHTHLPNRLLATHSKQTAGPAKNYSIKNSRSSVGIISADSNNFCQKWLDTLHYLLPIQIAFFSRLSLPSQNPKQQTVE
jgi:hypothetical protein